MSSLIAFSLHRIAFVDELMHLLILRLAAQAALLHLFLRLAERLLELPHQLQQLLAAHGRHLSLAIGHCLVSTAM